MNSSTSANNIGEVTVKDKHRQQDNNTSGSLPMRGGEREGVYWLFITTFLLRTGFWSCVLGLLTLTLHQLLTIPLFSFKSVLWFICPKKTSSSYIIVVPRFFQSLFTVENVWFSAFGFWSMNIYFVKRCKLSNNTTETERIYNKLLNLSGI